MKWVPTACCKPACFHNLMKGRKVIACVRRVSIIRNGKRVRRFQVPREYDIMGGSIGPVFPTLKAAKEFVEGRL